jgi:hypothetical protein
MVEKSMISEVFILNSYARVNSYADYSSNYLKVVATLLYPIGHFVILSKTLSNIQNVYS